MDVIHKQVRHQQFGIGTITQQDAKHITVEFSESSISKKFVYPIAFEKHLSFCSETDEADIKNDLHLLHCRDQIHQQRFIEDQKRKMEEIHVNQQLQKKRATAAKKASTSL